MDDAGAHLFFLKASQAAVDQQIKMIPRCKKRPAEEIVIVLFFIVRCADEEP